MGSPQFWLDLEMRGSSALEYLDQYLRTIWLDCCGHMSQFISGRRWGEEISMRQRIADVLEPGIELTHIYDFGTSSETLIKAVSVRMKKMNGESCATSMQRHIPTRTMVSPSRL